MIDPAWLLGTTGGGSVLAFVVGKFHRQDKEIKECRERDARYVVFEAGFHLVVGELVRTNPNSDALRMCGDLLNRKLGPAPDITDFSTLLTQLEDVPPKKVKRDA
jgi:hypothetical protein